MYVEKDSHQIVYSSYSFDVEVGELHYLEYVHLGPLTKEGTDTPTQISLNAKGDLLLT